MDIFEEKKVKHVLHLKNKGTFFGVSIIILWWEIWIEEKNVGKKKRNELIFN